MKLYNKMNLLYIHFILIISINEIIVRNCNLVNATGNQSFYLSKLLFSTRKFSKHDSIDVSKDGSNNEKLRVKWDKIEYLTKAFSLAIITGFELNSKTISMNDVNTIISKMNGHEVIGYFDERLANAISHYSNSITFLPKNHPINLKLNSFKRFLISVKTYLTDPEEDSKGINKMTKEIQPYVYEDELLVILLDKISKRNSFLINIDEIKLNKDKGKMIQQPPIFNLNNGIKDQIDDYNNDLVNKKKIEAFNLLLRESNRASSSNSKSVSKSEIEEI